MTKQEFISRANFIPTEEEFNHIHELYVETEMDKDAFCTEYMKIRNSDLFNVIAYNFKDLKQELSNLYDKYNELILNILDFTTESEFDEFPFEKFISKKDIIIYKLNRGIKLSNSDISFIKDKLK